MNHCEKSSHNIDTERYLHQQIPKYVDWQVTAIFYSALHLVSNHLKEKGIEVPERHGDMIKTLKRLSGPLSKCYHTLYEKSRIARYSTKKEISEEDLKIVKNNFEFLKSALS